MWFDKSRTFGCVWGLEKQDWSGKITTFFFFHRYKNFKSKRSCYFEKWHHLWLNQFYPHSYFQIFLKIFLPAKPFPIWTLAHSSFSSGLTFSSMYFCKWKSSKTISISIFLNDNTMRSKLSFWQSKQYKVSTSRHSIQPITSIARFCRGCMLEETIFAAYISGAS